jgi:hypothetical protein
MKRLSRQGGEDEKRRFPHSHAGEYTDDRTIEPPSP